MPKNFDAYHKWLGIPPAEQPPNHYRLLGISEFEADADVIDHAADQRMAHVRTFQAGPHAAEAQYLLNEIASAKVTLLNPTQRAEYDAVLKPAVDLSQEPLVDSFISATPRARPTKRAKDKAPSPLVELLKIAIGGVFGIFFAALLLSYFAGMDILGWQKKPVAKSTSDASREGTRPNSVVSPNVPRLPVERPVKGDTGTSSKNASILPGPVVVVANSKAQTPPPQQPPSAIPEATTGSKNVEPSATNPDNPPVQQRSIENPPDPESSIAKQTRFAAPSRAEQDAVRATLSELYKFSAIKTAEQKRELATKLIALSGDPTGNPAERFTLLRQAAEFARDGGDAELMLRAVGAIVAAFDVDREKVRQSMLLQFAEKATDEVAIASLFEHSRVIVNELVTSRQMDLATELVEVVLKACQRPNGRKVRKPALDQRNQVRQLAEKWKEIQQAIATLDSAPEDPAANLVYGRYLCLSEGNYWEGLPRLSKGTDKALREVAQSDLEVLVAGESAEATAIAKVADQWFSIARSQEPPTGFLVRAAYWYALAGPKVSGLEKVRVAQRLEELANLLPKQPTLSKAASKPLQSELPQIDGTWTNGEKGQGKELITIVQKGLSFTADCAYQHPKYGQIRWQFNGTLSPDRKLTGRLVHTKAPPDFKNQVRTATVASDDQSICGFVELDGGGQHEFTWMRESPRTNPSPNQSTSPMSPQPPSRVPPVAIGVDVKTAPPSPPKIEAADQRIELVGVLNGHNDHINCVALSRDGQWALSGGQKNSVHLWNIFQQQHVRPLTGHREAVYCVAFTPDGTLGLSGGGQQDRGDDELRVWNLTTGGEKCRLSGHQHTVRGVTVLPDGNRVISVSYDASIRLWDLPKASEIKSFKKWPVVPAGTPQIWSLAVSQDSRFILAGMRNNTAYLYEIESGRELKTFRGEGKSCFSAAAISFDGQRALAASNGRDGADNALYCWDLASGRLLKRTAWSRGSISSIVFLPDSSQALLAGGTNDIVMWDADKGVEVQQIPGHAGAVNALAISADGRTIISGSNDKTIRIWSLK